MVSRRSIRLILVTLCLSALLATGVALADFTSVTDGGKTRGPLDITSTSAGHASETKLVHTIVTEGRIPLTRRASFCVRIYFSKPSTSSRTFTPADRFICSTPRSKTTQITSGTSNNTFGTARVLRPATNAIAFRFKHSSIANDAVYWWAVDSFYNPSRGVCSGRAGCFDSAPNGRRTVKHHVGTVRFTG
jgi:hypothetical protein